MSVIRHIYSSRGGRAILSLAMLAILSLAAPTQAQAQCEVPGTTAATAATVVASQTAAITAMTTSLSTLYTTTIMATQGTLMGALSGMETLIQNRMRRFWDDWEQANQDMTAQLHAGMNDQSRQMSNLFDSSNLTENARILQTTETKAHQNYAPSEQACRFDTTASYMATATRTQGAMRAAVSQQFTDLGTNKAGTPAAQGEPAVNKSRWDTYRTRFCDSQANAGSAGCAGATPAPNAHIMPSRTIFARETIDMTNADNVAAVNELMYNITGYRVPEIISTDALASPAGKEQRQSNRAYLAQMDVATSLVGSIVAERTPGQEATEVQEMRQRMGINTASANPSSREIRQSVVEQLWDPMYYVGLTDSSNVVSQKEVFLQAYNLMLLYKLVEKTEKIAAAYAVETANLLEKKTQGIRKGGEKYAPTR